MAEEIIDNQSTEGTVEPVDNLTDPGAEEVKTFTQQELDDIVKKEKAKAKRSAEREYKAKMDEAEKLRQMNVEEKAAYEAEKQQQKIAELEAQLNRVGLEREAAKMLSEAGITSNDEILGFVVKGDAEATQEAVKGFSELVNVLADQKVSEMLKGKTPSKVESATQTMTQEQFDKLSFSQRAELYNNNRELYNQFAK